MPYQMFPYAKNHPSDSGYGVRRTRQMPSVLIALALALVLASGCSRNREEQPALTTGDGSSTVASATASATPPASIPSEDRPLTVWLPEFMTIEGDTSAANILSRAINEFEQRHPESSVDIGIKQQSGPNGMLSYLRSAQKVAPAILPDLVVLEGQDLWRAVDLGLAKPLTADSRQPADTFFASAQAAVEYQGDIYGIPYAMDLIHAIGTGAQPVPATWDEVLAGDAPYLFAGAVSDPNLNPTLVLQYLAAGGLLDETEVAPDVQATRALLDFYVAGLADDVIPGENGTLADTDAVWRQLAATDAAIGLVSAHAMLAQRDVADRVTYGPVPAATAAQRAVTQTFAFAIVTDDPERAELAHALIRDLLDPTVHGTWSQFAHYVPTTPAALETWGEAFPYLGFLTELLEDGAAAIPSGRLFYDYARRLQAAQNGVLSGAMSVDEAVNLVAPVQ